MDIYLDGFVEYLKATKSSSASTLQSYRRDVSQFVCYLTQLRINDFKTVDNKIIENYLAHLRKNGRSTSTISRCLSSLRKFFEYLLTQNSVSGNPAAGIKMKREKRPLPEILSNDEVEILLKQPDCKDFKGYRDKAMLEILYATGIRVSELVALDIQDIDTELGILRCRRDNKCRIIPIYPDAIKSVIEYVNMAHEILGCKENSAIFVNLSGKRLTRQGFWKIIKIYTKRAKIDKRITPQTLRHSFAAHLLENGADLKSIQIMLGYADISSTQIYERIVKNHYRKIYDKCHPMA